MSKETRTNEQEQIYQRERRAMFEIYGNACGICGSTTHLTAHHIVRRSEGGEDIRSNLYPLCREDHDMVENLIDSKEPKVIYQKTKDINKTKKRNLKRR